MKTKRSSLLRVLALLVASLALAGCATVAEYKPNPRDPLEPVNRKVTDFNEGMDAFFLKPVATLYRAHVPPLVRTGVANVFGNLSDAWSFVNSALQFKLQNATENLARVQLNTMFGLGGIFDVASEFNIERHTEDFGQTLGHWGVPAGPYLVLPFFGPSTLRDTLALPVDRRLDLVQRIESHGLRNAVYAIRAIDKRANLLRASSVLDEAALDKYSFVRDAYLQRRRAEVFEREGDPRGEPPEEPPPASPAPATEPPATPAAPPGTPSAPPATPAR
jgi:phospholipid-binding lipoprotein MlaA